MLESAKMVAVVPPSATKEIKFYTNDVRSLSVTSSSTWPGSSSSTRSPSCGGRLSCARSLEELQLSTGTTLNKAQSSNGTARCLV